MPLEIAIDPTDADFKTTVSLDGSPYVFRFDYSERSSSWFVSIFLQRDGDDAPIVQGVRVSVLFPFLIGVVEEGRPPGDVFALGPHDPGREDLGGVVKVYYFSEADLEPAAES